MKAKTIFGPPGTGKTSELKEIIERVVKEGTPEGKIAILSFTKTGAAEISRRANISSPFTGTMHSICFRLCEVSKNEVVNDAKLRDFEQLTGVQFSHKNVDEEEDITDGDFYLALYQLHAARLNKDYDETYNQSDYPGENAHFLYFCRSMDNWKEYRYLIDFNDMLANALKVQAPEIDVLVIDEAQDLSPLQWKVIRHWVREGNIEQIYIGLDDDQSVFRWGGADPQGGVKFEEFLTQQGYDVEREILTKSHRIPKLVHEMAERIITQVPDRVDKQYMPKDEEGTVNRYATVQSVPFQHGEDVLALYRSHHHGQELQRELLERGTPYMINGAQNGPLHNLHAKAITIFFRMQERLDEGESIQLSKKEQSIIKRLTDAYYRKLLEDGRYEEIILSGWENVLNVPLNRVHYYYEIIKEYGNLEVQPTIVLSTIHASKGMEADRVVLINGMTSRIAREYIHNPADELRNFYVSVNRTIHKIDIVEHENALNLI